MKIKLPAGQKEIERRLRFANSDYWYVNTLYPNLASRLRGKEIEFEELIGLLIEYIKVIIPNTDLNLIIMQRVPRWLDVLIDDKDVAVEIIMLFQEKKARKEIEVASAQEILFSF